MELNYNSFIDSCNEEKGKILETFARKSKFKVTSADYNRGIDYFLFSSQKTRNNDPTTIRKVLERYNETGSLRPKDYNEASMTFNASYILPLIDICVRKNYKQPKLF
jgi:hypothetical protein